MEYRTAIPAFGMAGGYAAKVLDGMTRITLFLVQEPLFLDALLARESRVQGCNSWQVLRAEP